MAAPCHHWPDIFLFLDIPVTDVPVEVIGLGCPTSSSIPDIAVVQIGVAVLQSGIIGLWKSEMMATRKPEHELYRRLFNFVGSTETQRWLNSNQKFSSLK
ncbi:hypothetical protein CSKR_106763 [Clonorchis sinensis]|uniref:Uncharacterized protein n=1 Tax=Clonorchis sinensis TaxID=79923 RepID=A0A3R7JQ57_CLOSI|nr:hypothetical protein CSKR_106763 [Clonorchis sinensis]